MTMFEFLLIVPWWLLFYINPVCLEIYYYRRNSFFLGAFILVDNPRIRTFNSWTRKIYGLWFCEFNSSKHLFSTKRYVVSAFFNQLLLFWSSRYCCYYQ